MLLKGEIPREEGFLRGQRCNRKGGLEVFGVTFWSLSKYAKISNRWKKQYLIMLLLYFFNV